MMVVLLVGEIMIVLLVGGNDDSVVDGRVR